MNKDQPYLYEIRVKGHLADRWSEWFDGLAIHHDVSGDTTLQGQIKDQAALLGILNKLYSLNLTLIGLIRVEDT